MTELIKEIFNNHTFHIRPNTKDFNCLKEIFKTKVYQKPKITFFVEKGESWLDLGANIGAFTCFAKLNGAKSVVAFEPDTKNFEILRLNTKGLKGVELFNSAVSSSKESELQFYLPMKENDYYRFSLIPNKRKGEVYSNIYAGELRGMKFDGIKMDIEGAEFDLIEQGLLPESNKLCFEYHHSKDKSMANFWRRIEMLKKIYPNIWYDNSMNKMEPDGDYKFWIDHIVFCWK